MSMLKVIARSTGGQRSECRSCFATVTWFETVGGRRIPFNGDVVFVRTERREDGESIGVIDTSINAPHFATCPQADSWRRRRADR